MKARITYVHDSGGEFDPPQVAIEDDSLSVRSLEGAREVKVTVGLDKLPGEVRCASAMAWGDIYRVYY